MRKMDSIGGCGGGGGGGGKTVGGEGCGSLYTLRSYFFSFTFFSFGSLPHRSAGYLGSFSGWGIGLLEYSRDSIQLLRRRDGEVGEEI